MEVKSVSGNSFDFIKAKDKPKETDVKTVTEAVNESLKEKKVKTEEKMTNEISKEDLEKNIQGVNKFLESNFTSLKFQVHEDLNRVFVEVVDRDTKEVVKEIPPKEFLDMISSMLDFVGLLVDKKV